MSSDGLIVCSWLPFPVTSGNRKRAVRLAEAMERAGATPALLTVEQPSREAVEEIDARGWKLHVAAPAGRSRPLMQHARGLPFPDSPSLATAVRRLAPQVAFVQLEEERRFQYARFLPPDGPTVMSAHNVDSQVIQTSTPRGRPYGASWWRAAWYVKRMQLTEARMARAVDAVICVSQDDREYFGEHAERVLLVPNGIDDDLLEVDPAPPDGDDVLFFGQLRYAPNVEGLSRLLASTWPAVLAARPSARLRVAGAGSDAPDVRSLLEGVEGVEAIGFVPDLKTELARSRLVVAPLWSGGGTRIKVLEALAAGRPVVGTPFGVGGLGFKDRVHGRIGESPRELADAILDLLGDEPAWRRAGAEGRRLASVARWASVTEPAESMYRRFVEAAERRPVRAQG